MLPVLVCVLESCAASICMVESFCIGKVVIFVFTLMMTENVVVRHFMYI